MPGYFDLVKITPPAPNDPTVNEVTQLNDNWDKLDTRLGVYRTFSGNPVPLQEGQEFTGNVLGYGKVFAVWDGTTLRVPDRVMTDWTAWEVLPVVNCQSVTGQPVKWRSNPVLRRVELCGSVIKDGAGSAWPASVVKITANTGGIPDALKPFGGKTFSSNAAAAPDAMIALVSGFYVKVYGNAVASTQIDVRYLGGPGNGNFGSLDGTSWWY